MTSVVYPTAGRFVAGLISVNGRSAAQLHRLSLGEDEGLRDEGN
jgi:hypothetical protein